MNNISIITVNRNNAAGLEKTIRSVIQQSYPSYEFIIIDGNSTDGSLDIIKRYSGKIKYWITEEDTGVFHAMNKGIRQASGDYCYFLNSGDILAHADILQKVFANKTYKVPFINGNQINDFGTHTQIVPCLNRELTLYDFYWGTIKHQATFIRRDLFDTYGLYDESLKIISDWKFFLQTIGLHNEQPEFVDVDIVVFEWNGMSTNPVLDDKHKKERQKVLEELIPASIRTDYIRMRDMSHYEYVVRNMKRSKLIDTIVRTVIKIFG